MVITGHGKTMEEEKSVCVQQKRRLHGTRTSTPQGLEAHASVASGCVCVCFHPIYIVDKTPYIQYTFGCASWACRLGAYTGVKTGETPTQAFFFVLFHLHHEVLAFMILARGFDGPIPSATFGTTFVFSHKIIAFRSAGAYCCRCCMRINIIFTRKLNPCHSCRKWKVWRFRTAPVASHS